MRRRAYLNAAQWAARLDSLMRTVLRDPDHYPPATLVWARWRRAWLAESGSLFHEPVERVEVDGAEGLTGPSSRPPRAGGPIARPR